MPIRPRRKIYELRGQVFSDVLLAHVTPDSLGNWSSATLTLTGDGFDDTTTVELVAPGGSVVHPTATNVISAAQMTATVDFPALAAGVYDVRVRKASGATSELLDALTVTVALDLTWR